MRVNQRGEVVDVVAVDEDPGGVLADFVELFDVFLGRQQPGELVELGDDLRHQFRG